MEEGVWLLGFKKVVQGQMLPRLNRAEFRKVDMPSKATFWAVLMARISIKKE